MGNMVRWAIVGLGRIAETEIAPAITASPGGTLQAVVSRDQGRADGFAARHGAARALTDFDEMLSDPDVDAVYIATPNALHAGQVVAAAHAGKHVLCDKPLATTVADAREAVAAAARAGVRLGVTFQTRFHEPFDQVRTLIRDGALGAVRVVQVEMSPGRTLLKGWRTDPAMAGLGALNNLGVHAFDLLRYLLGDEVSEVTALTGHDPGLAPETVALVLLRFASGALAYVNVNQSVVYPQADLTIYGTEGRIVGRSCTRMNMTGTVEVLTGDGQTTLAASSHDAYLRTVSAFEAALAAGRDPSPSGLDALCSVELTSAIAQAVADGRAVQVAGPAADAAATSATN